MDRLTRINKSKLVEPNCEISSEQEYDNYRTDCENLLAHYEYLIEQGKMIELPCRVGDVIYKIADKIIIEIEVRGFEIINNSIFILTNNYNLKFDVKLFNGTVFLTREEAEEKLKELQK